MLAATPAKRLKRFGARSALLTVVTFFTVFAAFPFYWMLITTFKRTGDLYNVQNNPFIFNDSISITHTKRLSYRLASYSKDNRCHLLLSLQ